MRPRLGLTVVIQNLQEIRAGTITHHPTPGTVEVVDITLRCDRVERHTTKIVAQAEHKVVDVGAISLVIRRVDRYIARCVQAVRANIVEGTENGSKAQYTTSA